METEHDVPEHEDRDDKPEAAPRGVHVMAFVRWALLAFMALAALGSWYGYARAEHGGASAQAAVKYQCPMHPQIVQDHPGECPICHMTLEPIDPSRAAGKGGATNAANPPGAAPSVPANPAPAPSAVAAAARGEQILICPMHPQIMSDKPGTCPICHMDLELLLPDGGTKEAPAATPSPSAHPGPSGHVHGAIPAPTSTATVASTPATSPANVSGPMPGTMPSGLMPVHLALDRVQSIGVRTAVVEERDVVPRVRVTASVLPTEQGVAQVHVRTPGFVEQVAPQATQTGVQVGSGALLFTMYSPEIFQAQSELLAASQWTDTGSDNGSRAATSARRKLELLGMSPKDIDRVVAKKEPLRAIPVYAPQGGVITKKNVVLGSYVTPEMVLYELQDLSKVYVVADVFPKDVAFLQKGMKGRFILGRKPEAPIEATVDLVYPFLDTEARTTRVRLTVKNAERALRPGDFGTVELDAPSRRVLSVPRDAVVDTGKVAYVFVVGQDGVFRPQVVQLMGEDSGALLVHQGVLPGVRVVSGATFLIDSESRLQAAVQAASSPPSAPSSSASGSPTPAATAPPPAPAPPAHRH